MPRILSYTAAYSWTHAFPDRPFRTQTVQYQYEPITTPTDKSVEVLKSIRSEDVSLRYNAAGVPSVEEENSEYHTVVFNVQSSGNDLSSEDLGFLGRSVSEQRQLRSGS